MSFDYLTAPEVEGFVGEIVAVHGDYSPNLGKFQISIDLVGERIWETYFTGVVRVPREFRIGKNYIRY